MKSTLYGSGWDVWVVVDKTLDGFSLLERIVICYSTERSR